MLADAREARALRSLRPRRRQCGAGGGAGFDPTIFAGLRRHLLGPRRHLRLRRHLRQRRRRGGPQRGADLRYDLEISFEESANGAETTIQIPREETCETCNGSGAAAGHVAPKPAASARGPGSSAISRASSPSRARARSAAAPARSSQAVPGAAAAPDASRASARSPSRFLPGIATGQRLRLYGEGEHGTAGGPPGDLYVVVHVQEHPFFHREDDDLYCEIPVSFPTLALGGDDQGADARRTTKRSTCPPGTQPGARFKLRGKGMPNVSRPRPRRSPRDRPRRRPEEARRRNRSTCSRNWARRCRRRSWTTTSDGQREKPFFERVKDIFG